MLTGMLFGLALIIGLRVLILKLRPNNRSSLGPVELKIGQALFEKRK